MMTRAGAVAVAVTTAVMLCGCAGQSAPPPSLLPERPLTNDATGFSYQLSDKEKKYDCKKLAGVMQIRILQIRDYDSKRKASLAARSVQTVATPIFGGTTTGIDPDAQYHKDRAMLEAYNAQLAAKKCKTYDLDAALSSQGLYDMPRPGPPPGVEVKPDGSTE